MKRNNLAKFAVLGLAVLLATGAFASNKGSLHVEEAVQVNGQQLPAGEYQLRWAGSGSDVQLSFMQGKKEVVKTSAKVVELQNVSPYDSAVVDHGSGVSLSQVRFAGKKFALAIGGSDASAMSASSSK
ncbi:MAG TPA: hypothetical protein VEK84_08810 [Terriglobales bacterium]|nr:hypothetical protein [Terriglobales bacterium]